MTQQPVIFERRGPLALLTLNRPEALNALNRPLLAALQDAVERVAADESIRALAVAGAGRAFSAGADLTEALGEDEDQDNPPAVERAGVPAFEALAALGIPTVAAIQGYALGGGLELALACDLRLVSEEAQLGLPEVTLGRLPFGGGTQRLPRLVGRGKALEMILTGEPIDAAEAVRVGLATRAVPVEHLLEEALALAAKLAELGPVALRYGKEAVWRGMDLPFEQGLRLEMDLSLLLHTTADRAEGIRAFREKRRPQFHGK